MLNNDIPFTSQEELSKNYKTIKELNLNLNLLKIQIGENQLMNLSFKMKQKLNKFEM